MKNFFLLALAGVIAQLVDGSLGMAYGVSSTTVLLAAGVAPALASAAVHMAEIGTTAVSGISHSSFGNVDWSKIVWLPRPRGGGGLFGGFVAGFLDAFGGGGWGPLATPTLLSSGRMEPRKIIGTVDTSEFVIAVCASIGFLFGLSLAEVPWTIVAALFVGGLIAAPIAAYIVRILPTRIMGTAVGGFILVVNANTFFGAVGLSSGLSTVAFIIIIAVWIAALAFAIGAKRQEQEEAVEGQAV